MGPLEATALRQLLDPRSTPDSERRTLYILPLIRENELRALEPGDLAKICFVGVPPGRTYEAERMWVGITDCSGPDLVGTLENTPFDLHQLRPGDVVHFRRSDVLDIRWSEHRAKAPPAPVPYREYWERCMVDRCVLENGIPVYFLYREEADLADPEDPYPDSGWRIRGDYRGVPDKDLDEWEQDYLAVGKVLNADDSWLHLIDAPIGSAYIRSETGQFVAYEDDPE